MSKAKNDGGPAFPLTADAVSHENRQFDMHGMTLRDYFAAKALPACIQMGACDDKKGKTHAEYFAMHAYDIADAMLAERSK